MYTIVVSNRRYGSSDLYEMSQAADRLSGVNLPEAANRLDILADAFTHHRVSKTSDDGYVVSKLELEAVLFAAGFLGIFAEVLEEVTNASV